MTNVIDELFGDLKIIEEEAKKAADDTMVQQSEMILNLLPVAAVELQALEDNDFSKANMQSRDLTITLPGSLWQMIDAAVIAIEATEQHNPVEQSGDYYAQLRLNTPLSPEEILASRAAYEHILNLAIALQTNKIQRAMLKAALEAMDENGALPEDT